MKWKTIPSTPLFEASSCGKIKRKITNVAFGSQIRKAGGKILSPKLKNNGYLEVNLSKKSKYVHRLVAEAWLGEIPKGFNVNHKDGDKSNNNVLNLEIVTYSQNSKHAFGKGFVRPPRFIGSKHPRAKTNESEVLNIRQEHNMHHSIVRLIKNYPHLSKHILTKIVYYQSWKHVRAF